MIKRLKGSSEVIDTSRQIEGSNSQGILQSYNNHLSSINANAQAKVEEIKKQKNLEIEKLNQQYIQLQAKALRGSSVEEFEKVMNESPEELQKPIQDLYFPTELKAMGLMSAAQRKERSEILKSQQQIFNWFDPSFLHHTELQKVEKTNPLQNIPNSKKAIIAVLTLLAGGTLYEVKHQHDKTSKPAISVPANPSTFSGKINK